MRKASLLLLIGTSLAASWAFANPAQGRLLALSEADRRQIFARILAGGGERCSSVTRLFHSGDTAGGDALWSVQCAGADRWMVVVYGNATGSTRYMSCAQVVRLGLPPCFKKGYP